MPQILLTKTFRTGRNGPKIALFWLCARLHFGYLILNFKIVYFKSIFMGFDRRKSELLKYYVAILSKKLKFIFLTSLTAFLKIR